MLRRVCDYGDNKPAVYEFRLLDAGSTIDTCRECTHRAVSIGVDNMDNTQFAIRWIGVPDGQ